MAYPLKLLLNPVFRKSGLLLPPWCGSETSETSEVSGAVSSPAPPPSAADVGGGGRSAAVLGLDGGIGFPDAAVLALDASARAAANRILASCSAEKHSA